VFYGLDDPGVHNRRDPLLEAMYCPCCGHELDFAVRYFGHSGDWRCPNCALHRPGLDFAATDIALTPRSSSFRIRGAAESMPVRLPIPALYNVYNALAAATAARVAGASSSATGEELCDYRAAFGRMETLRVDGRDVMLLLSKNPVAARQALAAVMVDDRPKHLALALNDNFADGRDISWIWDVDFEDFDLSRCFVVATGTRAYDMAVRLKYAGVPEERVRVEPDLARALATLVADMPPNELGYALATYTAMIEIRNDFATGPEAYTRNLGRVMRRGNA
jgi:UDP-N-acetylmuramyl tripeptide synthase